MTTVLSESFLQVTLGFGFPSAEQFSVNSAGAVTVRSFEVTMLLGVGSTIESNYSPHFDKSHATALASLQAALEV